MGHLAERLGRLEVDARSPDGNIAARVRGRDQVGVRFASGSYRSYREPELAGQLSQLATLTWARYRREYRDIMDAHLGVRAVTEDEQDRRFAQEQARLTVRGVSPGRFVDVSSRALVRWEFALAGGTVGALSQERFLAELDAAIDDLLRDHRFQSVLLAARFYDLGVPIDAAGRAPVAGRSRDAGW